MNAAELREARSALVDTVERFARTEIAPHVSAWDAAGEFPRSLYRRAAELGLLGVGYPEEYGGTPAPYALRLPMWRALCRFGTSGGVQASLFSHNIGLPPVVLLASDAVRQEVVPPVLAGERISALAITEPGGGSDVAQLRTTARREGDEYVVNGEKIFITSGMRADWITLAVRTGESKGASGISLLLVPGDSAGLSRARLDKMGWLCSDTAHLRFDGVRVPARYLLGEEGQGFKAIMGNFNGERLGLAAGAIGYAEACYDEALAWAQQRQSFGRRHAPAHLRHRRLAGGRGRARRRRRCLARLGGRSLHPEEPGHADDAVLRRRRRADPGRHGLHARHGVRAHLPRGQGRHHRWRHRRNHEGAGGAPVGHRIERARHPRGRS